MPKTHTSETRRPRKSARSRDGACAKPAPRPVLRRSRKATATKTRVLSKVNRYKKTPRSNASGVRETGNEERAREEEVARFCSRLCSLLRSRIDFFMRLGSKPQIVHEQSNQSAGH